MRGFRSKLFWAFLALEILWFMLVVYSRDRAPLVYIPYVGLGQKMQSREESWPSYVCGLTGELEHILMKKVILRVICL